MEAAPTPSGGRIVDGTYVLLSMHLYNSLCRSQRNTETLSVCDGAMNFVVDSSELTRRVRYSYGYAVNGTTIQSTWSCPVTAFEQGNYTATPTTLLLFILSSEGTWISTYVRR
jgi:hypothetical protein